MTAITDIPHSPLPSRGQWPQSYLDDIHLYLASAGGQPTFANVLINGGMEIWQRGTTFAAIASGYTADRWFAYGGGGAGLISVNRQQYVPTAPAFTIDGLPTSTIAHASVQPNGLGGAPAYFAQRMRYVNLFAGEYVSFSALICRGAGAAVPLTAAVVQNFGTGGAPSASVTTIIGTITPLPLSTSQPWQLFSGTVQLPTMSGKSLGSNANDYLEFRFQWDVGASTVMNITAFDFRRGAFPGTFNYFDPGIVIQLCQRFYQKSYLYSEFAGASSFNGARNIRSGAASATVDIASAIPYMRTVPTTVIYSPNSGTANRLYNANTAADMTVTGTSGGSETSIGTISLSAVPAAGDRLRYHYTLDAEIY